MKRLLIFLLLGAPAFAQFGNSNARRIQGLAVKGPLVCSDTQVLTWVNASSWFDCLAGGSSAAAVLNNATNTGTAAMTLDMSLSSSAAAHRVPNIAGAASTTAGAISYDTTNKNYHGGANGVDNIIPVVPVSLTITDSNCVSWSNVAGVITLKQAAGACAAGGSGTVNSGTQGQLAWYASSTTAVSGNANFALNAGGTAFATLAGLTTAGTGVPIVSFATDVTGQSTSQSTVTIATTPAGGIYRLSYYADMTTPCTTGSNSVSFSFGWTDAGGARTLTTGSLTMGTAQTATSYLSGGPFEVSVASGNVTYTSTVAGTCATGTSVYEIRPTFERVK